MKETFPILSTLIFLPLAGALLLMLVPRRKALVVKVSALILTLAEFAVSLPLFFNFDEKTAAMQFVEQREWFPEFGISYLLGIDGISMLLVMLTTFLTVLCVLCSWEAIEEKIKEYYISFLLLETALIGALSALDLVLFYIFWELMLVPMYLLIGVWGGPRRIYAAIKFFLFTMVGSVLMLLAIMVLYFHHGGETGQYTFNVFELYRANLPVVMQYWLFAAFALSFAIKVPMFPVPHLAARRPYGGPHGGERHPGRRPPEDGRLRVPPVCHAPLPRGSRRRDAPDLVAGDHRHHLWRRHVHHADRPQKADRLLFREPSRLCDARHLRPQHAGTGRRDLPDAQPRHQHGGLFLIVGMIYERRHTRMIADFGGLSKVMPRLAVFFMIVTLSSIALPGTNGFVGEFLILLGTFRSNILYGVLATTGVILGAVYMLWMFQRVMFGKIVKEENSRLKDLTKRETAILCSIVLFVFLMGLYPGLFLKKIDASATAYLNYMRSKTVVAAPPGNIPIKRPDAQER